MSGEDAAPVDAADRTGACGEKARAARVSIEVPQWFHDGDPFCRSDRAAIGQMFMKMPA
jgi:hypothetical protein